MFFFISYTSTNGEFLGDITDDLKMGKNKLLQSLVTGVPKKRSSVPFKSLKMCLDVLIP